MERLRDAAAAGLTDLGENRVQEAAPKIAALAGASPRLRWHMVGRLQSNKARRAVELFDELHSVDSLDLARRLSRTAADPGRAPLPIYLQANVDADPAKAGFAPEALAAAIDELAALPGLELRGLMTVGRPAESPEDTRPAFAALRLLSERLRRQQPALGAGLSMGMSDDFEAAIVEGATVVRIGRALFGERPPG